MEPTKDQVIKAYDDAPPLVRDAFNAESTTEIVLSLKDKYGFHVDQAGVLGKQVGYLLLGLVDPQTFFKNLQAANVHPDTVSLLIKDLNEKIFQPLQRRMRGEDVPAKAPPREAPKAAPEPRPEVPVMQVGEVPTNLPGQPTSVPPPAAPPPPPPPPPAPSFTYVPEPAPQPQPTEPAASTPIYSTYASEPVATQLDPRPFMRTMATDMEAASHGMHGTPATPAQSFQTASIPVTFAAPPSYAPASAPQAPPVQATYQPPPPVAPPPPVPPPPPVRTYAPPVTAPVRLTPIDRTHGNAPLTKEFGTDPYREPIE